MIGFKVLKQSTRSQARLGILVTPHGEVETPCLVPVATQASVKTLTSEQIVATGSQLLISNTLHLHLKPGEGVVKHAGGLHAFMHWPRALMTDSGGFQVFSLGFGADFNTSKVLKTKSLSRVSVGQQPRLLKITDEGVEFTSFLDGRKLWLGPKESIAIQQKLGADIILAFDECPPPQANEAYVKHSLERTHRWAEQSLQARTSQQAMYGIVQGGKYKRWRLESARYISGLGFDGFGIGGEFGADKATMVRMLSWVNKVLPATKPRHLLGIGYLADIPKVIKAGVDTFDCIVPTHFARHGIAFTSRGNLDLSKSKFLTDSAPLDAKCNCVVCQGYKRSYLAHLCRAKELTALQLLTFHNLYFFNTLVATYRQQIKQGRL